MRKRYWLSPPLVLAGIALGACLTPAAEPPAGNHGTAVHIGKAWEAYHRAGQESKLLLLVHISGMFEDPAFT